MINDGHDMSVAVNNIQSFEDSVARLCDYQQQMNRAYLGIITSIRILMEHGVEKECDTLQDYITAFKEKFPAAGEAYAIMLLESAANKYDEFYTAYSTGTGIFQHATVKGVVTAVRIYKELERDMFYNRGVKFDNATDKTFVAVSNLEAY